MSKVHLQTIDTPEVVTEQEAPQQAGPATPAPLPALVVGAAQDPAESAADRMAEAALNRVRTAEPQEHRHSPGCEHLRREVSGAAGGSPVIGAAGGALEHTAQASIENRRGSGDPLPGGVLRQMESGFGRSFSSVRIHTDSAAADLATGMSAAAFTTGSDVFFGAGQFQPGTPDGDHMIAHELAHVVQSDSSVHRSFFDTVKKGLGIKEKSDEEKAKEIAAAQEKKDQKAAAKQEAAQNKKLAKDHKNLEKQHKAAQKQDRAVGQAQRDKLAEVVSGEQTGGAKTSQKMNELYAELDRHLVKEADLFALLCLQMDDEKARDAAYKQIWLVDAPPEIKAIRPPRETAAERLTSSIRQQRTQDNVDSMSEEQGALGGMLSKKVERIYELGETEYDKLVELFPDLSDEMRRQLVDTNVWSKQPEEVRAKRPTDHRIEAKAREDARKRLHLRPTPGPEKPPPDSMWDKHSERLGHVQTGVGVTGKVGKVPSLALKKVGAPKDKALNPSEPASDDPVAKTMVEKAPGPIGELAKSTRETQNRVIKGQAKDKEEAFKQTSDETKAATGIAAVTGILGGLLSTVQGIFTACKAIARAHEERSARNVLAATKASADAVKSAAGTAKSVAGYAATFDAGVMNAVNSFIPGLNIAISSLGLISQGCSLADIGMRMHETNNAVFDTRVRGMGGGGESPDVLIFPLLQVASATTKRLEQETWSTGVAVSDLATGIATVASGGGYGIPTAVQAGVKVVDLLHKLGHVIADDVLARITAKSRTDAMQSLEGSSEGQLRKDPAMAVDALIVQARKGDAIAVKWVTGYVSEQDLQNKKLAELRSAIVGAIGVDADPLTMYQKFKGKLASVKDLATGVSDKFSGTGAMAKERNALDGKSRGFGWRVKMMFKTETKFKRSVAKTEAMTGHGLGAVLCAIGSTELPLGADDAAVDTFLNFAKTISDSKLQAALKDPRNRDQESQDILLYIIQDRAAAEQSA